MRTLVAGVARVAQMRGHEAVADREREPPVAAKTAATAARSATGTPSSVARPTAPRAAPRRRDASVYVCRHASNERRRSAPALVASGASASQPSTTVSPVGAAGVAAGFARKPSQIIRWFARIEARVARARPRARRARARRRRAARRGTTPGRARRRRRAALAPEAIAAARRACRARLAAGPRPTRAARAARCSSAAAQPSRRCAPRRRGGARARCRRSRPPSAPLAARSRCARVPLDAAASCV